jgi:hypothetical protein
MVEISTDEFEDFGGAFFGVRPGPFRLNDLAPPGRPDRWALRLPGRRDTSGLQGMAAMVAAVDTSIAIVVVGTSPDGKHNGDRGPSVRTVAVFVDGACHCPLIAVKRRDEEHCEDWSSLSAEMLAEASQVLSAKGMVLPGVAVVSLEPELSAPDDRERFIAGRHPYAIQVTGDDLFTPRWSIDDPDDSFDPEPVDQIFELRHTDPAKPAVVQLRDLDGKGLGGGVAFQEYLFRFTGPEGPRYFLACDVLPLGAAPGELLRGAVEQATLALAYADCSPCEKLRLHEFRHPNEDPYYASLRIADRWRYLDGLGKDDAIA